MEKGLGGKTYQERFQKLNLRKEGDMIETFKDISGVEKGSEG